MNFSMNDLRTRIICVLSLSLFIGLMISCDNVSHNSKTINEKKSVKEVKLIPIIQGQYDRYINDGIGFRPCPDTIKAKDYITEEEMKKLPIRIYNLWEADSLRIDSDVSLEECYMVLVADRRDTLDFNYIGDWFEEYYTRLSKHNIKYSELDKIIFVAKEQTIGCLKLELNKEEFEKEFKELVPYLKLRKVKK